MSFLCECTTLYIRCDDVMYIQCHQMRLWTQGRQMGAYAARAMAAHTSMSNSTTAISLSVWVCVRSMLS